MFGLVGPLVFAVLGGMVAVAAVLFVVPARPASEPWKPCLMKGAAWAPEVA